MQRNHLQLYTISVVYLLFLFLFHYSISSPFPLFVHRVLRSVCLFFFVSCCACCHCVVAMGLFTLLYLKWRNLSEKKNITKFTHTEWHLTNKKKPTQRNGKDSKLLHSAHFLTKNDEFKCVCAFALVHVFALNHPYYHHTKENSVHFSCHFVLHYSFIFSLLNSYVYIFISLTWFVIIMFVVNIVFALDLWWFFKDFHLWMFFLFLLFIFFSFGWNVCARQ